MQTVFDRSTIKTGGPQAPVMETARGFRADYSPLIQAQQPVQINSRGFVAEAGALGDVGDGLQRSGGALDQIIRKMVEAINTRRIAEAEMRMDQAHADIAVELAAEPDPAKWGEITARRTAEIEKALITKDLSPDARDAIALRHLKWSTLTQGEVRISSARQQFALTAQTLQEGYLRALDNGDYGAAAEAVNTLSTGGYIAPDTAARMEIGIKDAEETRGRQEAQNLSAAAIYGRKPDEAKAIIQESPFFKDDEKLAEIAKIDAVHAANLEKDQLQELTLMHPEKAVTALEDPEKFPRITGGDRAAALVSAKQTQATMASDAFRDVKTRIELGQVKPDETFEGPGMEQLTPLMRDVLKAHNADRARVSSMNNPEAFQKAETAIDSYLPQDGDDLKRAEFEAYLETAFSGPYLDSLKTRWKDKTEGKAGTVDTGEAFTALDRWAFDEQRLGAYKTPVLDSEGRPVLKKDPATYYLKQGWFGDSTVKAEDTYTAEEKADPVKRDKVAEEVGRIKETVRKEIKDGKLTDSAAVFRRMAELSKMPLTYSAAVEAAGAPAIPASGDMPDINGGGLPAANPLLDQAFKALNYAPARN